MSQGLESNSQIQCVACSTANARDDQFCSGCGHGLWEKCAGCSTMVALGANFCNKCGQNLKESLEQRIASVAAAIDRAANVGKDGGYRESIRLLEPLTGNTDFRFKELKEKAVQLLQQHRSEQGHWESRITDIQQAVGELVESQKYDEIIKLVSEVPSRMRTEDLQKALEEASANVSSGDDARAELKAALAEKKWDYALQFLDMLLDIYPNSQKYQNLLPQLLEKLSGQAAKLRSAGRNPDALALLTGIPLKHQTMSVKAAIENLEELINVRRIVASEAFAQPVVGAMVEKLVKIAPDDPRVGNVSNAYAQRRGTRPAEPHHLYPTWMKSEPGIFTDQIEPSGLPLNLPGARPEALAKNPGRYIGAYGLALFGLGIGDESANFLAGKSGLFGMLGRKKKLASESAWGVDIGDSSIKAIKVSLRDGKTVIDDAFITKVDFESIDRGRRKPALTTVFKALEKTLTEGLVGEIPVITNLPGCDLLARYLELPAANPKQHTSFIEQEVDANIPIKSDLLSTTFVKFELETEAAISQRAIVLALKRSDVEARQSMFNKLGRNLVGMIADPFAILNALNHLGLVAERTEREQATLLLDVGSTQTWMVAATKSGGWYRQVDWGLDDVSVAVSRDLKLNKADADKVRRNPATSKSIYSTLKTMDATCAVPKRELERSLRAAREQLGNFDVNRILLTGGGAHQALLNSMLNGTLIRE